MKEIALVDADLIAYRCSASANNDPVEIAISRADGLMERLLYETNAVSYKAFLTGSNNFRKTLYPEYKANRTQEPPRWLQYCREHLVVKWQAKVTDGIEADDALGIEQTLHDNGSIIISLDKDLLQVPGWHYSWEIQGTSTTGKQWVKPAVEQFISPLQGLRKFYGQIITGDAADNVPAFDGKMRTSLPKFVAKLLEPLEEMTTEEEMYDYVSTVYVEQGEPMECSGGYRVDLMNRNASVLYVLREEEKYWQVPN